MIMMKINSKRHKKVYHKTRTYFWRLWELFKSKSNWKENKLEKNKLSVDSLRENHKDLENSNNKKM